MKNKVEVKDLAKQRIRWLYRMAYDEVRKGNYGRARRYAELIIRVAEKGRIRVPRSIKRSICRKCKVILVPGITARIRIRSEGSKGSHVTVTCTLCGWMKRYYIKAGKYGGKGERVSKGS